MASCRVDVKQAAAAAERWLEHVAEPLATCWQPADEYPHAFLGVAWKDMVRNAADLLEMLADGRVRPHVGATFGLSEVVDALRHVADGRAIGKVLLDVRPGS